MLLVIGTSKSAKVTAVLVMVKIVALTAFIALAIPAVKAANFEPMLPNGWGTPLSGVGVLGAAASIFFAYVGFDAVSTAAEETKNPNRNIPIGLIGSLAICTVFYLLVAYARRFGAVGARSRAARCRSPRSRWPSCCASIGRPKIGNWVGGRRHHRAAVGRADDDLRPDPHPVHDGARRPAAGGALARCTRRFHTPHIVTIITGVVVSLFAAMFPVGTLADISNSGTLFAFFMVALGVMMLRSRPAGPPASPSARRWSGWSVRWRWPAAPCCSSASAWYPRSSCSWIWAVIGLVVYFGLRPSQQPSGDGTGTPSEQTAS